MAKFKGYLGFSISSESEPGAWTETVTEVKVTGDLLKDYRKNDGEDKVVGNVSISNRFSFVMSPKCMENLNNLRYIKYLGIPWKVEGTELEYPRAIISVGGVYNGKLAESTT